MKDLKSLVDSYLKPLCTTLGLQDLCSQVGDTAATWVAAGAGAVRVYLQHALVTPQLGVGPATEWKPWFSVEAIGAYLPVTIAVPGVKFGLQQQADVIVNFWNELQELFNEPQLAQTREWRDALASTNAR